MNSTTYHIDFRIGCDNAKKEFTAPIIRSLVNRKPVGRAQGHLPHVKPHSRWIVRIVMSNLVYDPAHRKLQRG